jgi:branched-chain amino acid transport system permease protein
VKGLAVAALILIVCIVPFAADAYVVSMLVLIAFNGIAAIGLGLLMGTVGEVSLAQAAFMGIGAYAAASSAHAGLNPWLAILVAPVVVAVVAAFVGYPTLRLRGHYLTLATLGLGVIATVFFNEVASITGGPQGLGDFGSLQIGSYVLAGDRPFYALAWIAVALVAVGVQRFRASARGRALRAIAASETAAAAMGVSVRLRKLEAFVLSAVIAGFAGALYAFYVGYVTPVTFGFEQSVLIVVMVVLGGAATTLGPLAGAFIYQIAAALLAALGARLVTDNAQAASAALQVTCFGVLLVVVVRFLPSGIVGAAGELLARRRERERPPVPDLDARVRTKPL